MTQTIVLDTPLQRARGVIGRYPDPGEEYRLEFRRVATRVVHMLGVRQPLAVTFIAAGEVTGETVLAPWTGIARARCDTIVEAPPEGMSS